ncbi:YdhR family protein [Gloeobacter kilaueensis]|uniref:Monooxygenase n=1 Tax=Gloeobacter kilaueensis (strain ATCC BAA-2537 / CCAP 1431/1 / ULC 316 / JS1) TaxID=1183438 RepID=U5QP74_GLOK1|nr:YdhR family protein [Gloeobacter kilaueensis]AGY59369.1 hypothetical protein GKIL_3123 [Gloeobacter kilaueensis JS1]
MSPNKVFLYTELQASKPFSEVNWQLLNPEMKKEKGLLKKTWLSGIHSNSVGGFYEFDSLENARAFADGFFAREARQLGVSFTTKIFDGEVVEEASRDMRSPYYD